MPTRVLHIVPHTHWDREWYEPFDVVRFRLVKVMDEVLEALDDPAFTHFMMDGQTSPIEDYLEIRPGAEDDVRAAVRAGRLSIGPWRIIADQFLCSPETLVRNLQQGAQTAEQMGGSMPVGYLPDPFGHVGQMPQLLRLAGIEDAAVWRGVPSAIATMAFRWEAPDGSAVRAAYMPFGYGHAAALPTDPDELLGRAQRIIDDLQPFAPGDIVIAPNGSDHVPPQLDLPAAVAAAAGRDIAVTPRIGSLPAYIATLPPIDDLPAWRGELRSGARANLLMGVLSARMPLKQLESRASSLLERYAEPLTVLGATTPGRLLDRAWRAMVANSAHDSVTGCGIDAVAGDVERRYQEAIRLADLIAADGLEAFARSVDTSAVGTDAEGAVIVNPSPHARGGVVEVTLTAPTEPAAMAFLDATGARLAAQPIEVREQVALDMTLRGAQLEKLVPMVASRRLSDLYVNALSIEPGRPTTIRLDMGMAPAGSFDVEDAKRSVEALARRSPRAKFHVIGMGPPLATMMVDLPELPGLGWTTVRPVEGKASIPGARADAHLLDNGSLTASVAADGTVTVGGIAGALALVDNGDVGDEYNTCPPDADLVVDAPSEPVVVDVGREGPVEASLIVRRRYRVPAASEPSRRVRKRVKMDTTTVLSLRADEPFLRASITIDNTATDHRVRAIIPLPFAVDRSHADGAFEVVERGLHAEGGPHETGLPTFPSRRWVDVSDGRRGVAVFHHGLPEYQIIDDGRALAITLLRCVGLLSTHGMPTRAAPAGPVVETPGAQLPGVHTFDLAIYPHVGDWRAGSVPTVAERFLYPLRATGVRPHDGTLADHGSALSIEPPDVHLSALQPVEGGADLRVLNTADHPVVATIRTAAPLQVSSATTIGLLGDDRGEITVRDGAFEIPLRSFEIATIRVRP